MSSTSNVSAAFWRGPCELERLASFVVERLAPTGIPILLEGLPGVRLPGFSCSTNSTALIGCPDHLCDRRDESADASLASVVRVLRFFAFLDLALQPAIRVLERRRSVADLAEHAVERVDEDAHFVVLLVLCARREKSRSSITRLRDRRDMEDGPSDGSLDPSEHQQHGRQASRHHEAQDPGVVEQACQRLVDGAEIDGPQNLVVRDDSPEQQ